MDKIFGENSILKLTATELVCSDKWYSAPMLTYLAAVVLIIIGWSYGYMNMKSTISIAMCLLLIHCIVKNQCEPNGSLINLVILVCIASTFCVFVNMSYTIASGKNLQIPYFQ